MLLVTVIGIMWFIVSPFIFIYAAPQSATYNQWMSNYFGSITPANQIAVWMDAIWIVEVPLFFIGIFWAGDILGFVRHHT